jgi:hypothetical protein
MLPGAKAGDVIWYFKTDDKKKGGILINPKEIDGRKYKVMFIETIRDALKFAGYGSGKRIESEIFMNP